MATSKRNNPEPPAKRSKTIVAIHDGDGEEESSIYQAWMHYRNFIGDGDGDEDADADAGVDQNADDAAETDGGGDVDELLELIEILTSGESEVIPMPVDPSTSPAEEMDEKLFRTTETLLPILMSMSYLNLANHAITETMYDPQEEEQSSGNDEKEEGEDQTTTSPEYYFGKSLHYWPTNPAAHSLLANYQRMNSLASLDDICNSYGKAAEYANRWRSVALEFLQSDFEEELEGGMNAKEWVELLVLNGALDIDYIGYDDEEDEDECGEGGGQNARDEEEEQGEYSCSEVEATASFMSAFLLSTLSRHTDALKHLKKFNLSHRIHPNVWKEAQSHSIVKKSSTGDKLPSVLFPPRMYRGEEDNGVLPQKLYNHLCTLLAPNAPYWDESDYNNRGYYSYFIDLDSKNDSTSKSVRDQPTNVIEDVIVNHLLPLAERTLKENSPSEQPPRIVGAEWWTHTRPLGANLGHQIHFDTDESLLGREKKCTHPIVSSVLYLTGAALRGSKHASSAGSTIVFGQTPDSTDVASRAWISHPSDNAFMNFPGDLLHGVLPCAGSGSIGHSSTDEQEHRLTLMVGFWTRNVPEGMGERELYSPCGPHPPATSEHSWVTSSQEGYGEGTSQASNGEDQRNDSEYDILSSVSPAWEHFDCNERQCTTPALTIPTSLDHRFFVLDAPHCFSESLFEKDDCF